MIRRDNTRTVYQATRQTIAANRARVRYTWPLPKPNSFISRFFVRASLRLHRRGSLKFSPFFSILLSFFSSSSFCLFFFFHCFVCFFSFVFYDRTHRDKKMVLSHYVSLPLSFPISLSLSFFSSHFVLFVSRRLYCTYFSVEKIQRDAQFN